MSNYDVTDEIIMQVANIHLVHFHCEANEDMVKFS